MDLYPLTRIANAIRPLPASGARLRETAALIIIPITLPDVA